MSNKLQGWLTLFHIPGLGPSVLARLLRHFESADDVIAADPAALLPAGVPADLLEALRGCFRPGIAATAAANDLRWLESGTNHIVTIRDDSYPPLLRQIDNPPPLLYVSGNIESLLMPQIAVVGSRSCTVYGRESAGRLSRELALSGLSICSGLASGIDAAAHQAAVIADKPTIAVLGNGLDTIYPERNTRLARQILERGALVSEFARSSPPKPDHFPQRNRIISGMSVGVIVVEAALRSGSLITARLAVEQNREVFAVPGSIRSRHSRGCHRLLREGAALVETSDDVLPALASLLGYQLGLPGFPLHSVTTEATEMPGRPTETERRILAELACDPVPLDLLLARTGIVMPELITLLMQLEMKQHVRLCAGGYVRIEP